MYEIDILSRVGLLLSFLSFVNHFDLQVKEMQLQDLLDAKTAALSQSDHFIAQYRCRSAQSEAEVHHKSYFILPFLKLLSKLI